MAKRRRYETEVFCAECDEAVPEAVRSTSASAARRWANRHAERTGHEAIVRYS